jgi:hypothetical protein
MNKKRYWDVFLKNNDRYGWMYEDPSSKLTLFNNPVFYTDFHSNQNLFNGLKGAELNGTSSLQLTSVSGNIPIYKLKATCLQSVSNSWIYVSLWGNTNDINNDGCLITQIKSPDGKIYFTNKHCLMDDMAGTDEWERVQYIDSLSSKIMPDDSIIMYAKCTKGAISIDDIGIRFGTKK